MKQNRKLYKNQSGSTLILVLICMTFIGLLGSAILTATVSNMKMKTVDALSKDNFYTAEAAVDELKVGLEETAQLKMKEAYAYLLQRYSVTPDSERNQIVMKKFVTLFYNSLAVTQENGFVDATSNVDVATLKTRYLISTTGRNAEILNTSGSAIGIHKDMTDLSVTLTNVMVGYTDASGYETKITTDIKISANYPSLATKALNNRGIYYADYALIADGTISKTGGTDSNVLGNVYGGAGIIVAGNGSNVTKLKLSSNYIITRNDIEVSNRGQLEVPGVEKDGFIQNGVWASNLVTNSSSGSMTNSDYMILNANCYIADDLTMNAAYGDIQIRGTYYGYHTKEYTPEFPDELASGSSSIAINAKKANLDLSQLDLLWLAGKTYLSVPSIYGSTELVNYSQVLQGESIALKVDQIAYLVPSNCIVGIGHNPMTVDEYNKIGNEDGCYIDMAKSTENGGVDLTKYVTSYQVKRVNYVNNDSIMQMVYLYLKFADATKASDYFVDYYAKNATLLNDMVKKMSFGSVILPTEESGDMKVVNSGTVLTYSPISGTSLTLMGRSNRWGAAIDTLESELETKEITLTGNYQSLISYLDEEHLSTSVPASLVENLIRYSPDAVAGVQGILADADARVGTRDIIAEGMNDTGLREYILITDRTENIVLDADQDGKHGLIVATGDVVIKQCTFTGLIITKGKIIIEQDGHVKADAGYIKSLIDSRDDINQYFKDYVDHSALGSHGDNVVEITYENWYRE